MMSPAYPSAGGIDGGWRRRPILGGGRLFRCDPVPVRPFRLAFRSYDTRNGTGAYLFALVPLSVVSRSCRWCSGW